LQLNAATAGAAVTEDDMSEYSIASKADEPLLEHAPESERSDAFSIPISEGDMSSARQGFNQVLNMRMSGKAPGGKSGLMMSLGKDSGDDDLDNLEIGLDSERAA